MKRLALITALLIAGCAHGSNAILPSTQASAVLPDLTPGTWQSFLTPGTPIVTMVEGHDSAMWAVLTDGTIGRIDMQGNETIYKLGGQALTINPATDQSIASDTPNPDGNIYVTEQMPDNSYAIAQVTPTGTVTDFAIPGNAEPFSLESASDGNIWMLRQVSQDVTDLAFLTPQGRYTDIGQSAVAIGCLVRGSDKNLWCLAGDGVSSGAAQINVPTGNVNFFPMNIEGRYEHLALGSDKALWATNGVDMLRIDMQGNYTLYPFSKGFRNEAIGVAAESHYLYFETIGNLHVYDIKKLRLVLDVPLPKSPNGLGRIPESTPYVGPSNTIWNVLGSSVYIYSQTI